MRSADRVMAPLQLPIADGPPPEHAAKESGSDLVRAVAMALLLHVGVLGVVVLGALAADGSGDAASEPIALEAGLIDLSTLPAAMPGGSPMPEMPMPQPDAAAMAATSSPPAEPEPAETEPVPEETTDPDANEPLPSDSVAASVEANSTSNAAFEGLPYSDEDRKRRLLALREASRTQEKFAQGTYVSGRAQESIRSRSIVVVRVAYPQDVDVADAELLARYQAELQEALLNYWVRPGTMPAGQPCRITIEQLPGGEVVDVRVDETCPFDESGRQTLMAAIRQAQPLPYAGYESVVRQILSLDVEVLDR